MKTILGAAWTPDPEINSHTLYRWATVQGFISFVLPGMNKIGGWWRRYPPKKFPPKKIPAIKFPKMTTWEKKFPAKKFPSKKFPAIEFPKLTYGPKSFRPKSFQKMTTWDKKFPAKKFRRWIIVFLFILYLVWAILIHASSAYRKVTITHWFSFSVEKIQINMAQCASLFIHYFLERKEKKWQFEIYQHLHVVR